MLGYLVNLWMQENNNKIKESRITWVKYSRPGGTPTGTDNGATAEGTEGDGAVPKSTKSLF